MFDSNRPLVVISEGLINYFDKDLLKQLIQSIAHYGASFKKLHYLTDLYPEPVKNKLASIIWNSSKLLKLMSRSSFSFHFKTPLEVKDFLKMQALVKLTLNNRKYSLDKFLKREVKNI